MLGIAAAASLAAILLEPPGLSFLLDNNDVGAITAHPTCSSQAGRLKTLTLREARREREKQETGPSWQCPPAFGTPSPVKSAWPFR